MRPVVHVRSCPCSCSELCVGAQTDPSGLGGPCRRNAALGLLEPPPLLREEYYTTGRQRACAHTHT
eukprot:6649520-Alexandrium_andersonii.AAC.1